MPRYRPSDRSHPQSTVSQQSHAGSRPEIEAFCKPQTADHLQAFARHYQGCETVPPACAQLQAQRSKLSTGSQLANHLQAVAQRSKPLTSSRSPAGTGTQRSKPSVRLAHRPLLHKHLSRLCEPPPQKPAATGGSNCTDSPNHRGVSTTLLCDRHGRPSCKLPSVRGTQSVR